MTYTYTPIVGIKDSLGRTIFYRTSDVFESLKKNKETNRRDYGGNANPKGRGASTEEWRGVQTDVQLPR